MEPLIFALLFPLPLLLHLAQDPAPGATTEFQETRNLYCHSESYERARVLFPGRLSAPPTRGDFTHSDALICERRVLELGERPSRDEAILDSLTAQTSYLAEVAVASTIGRGTVWLVEAFYPDPAIAAKIAFALKVALKERGQHVSDRVPVLAADDLQVLTRMEPMQAYAAACVRYTAHQAQRTDDGGESAEFTSAERGRIAPSSSDTLLMAALTDERETVLHAGVCEAGAWRWLW